MFGPYTLFRVLDCSLFGLCNLSARGHQTANIHLRMFGIVHYFFNIEIIDVQMFDNFQIIESWNFRSFSNIRMFESSMLEWSWFLFLNPCSYIRMFAEHERIFEHWFILNKIQFNSPKNQMVRTVQRPGQSNSVEHFLFEVRWAPNIALFMDSWENVWFNGF